MPTLHPLHRDLNRHTSIRTAGRTPYREIGGPKGLLARRKPFEGSSMSADLYEHNGKYVVYSYDTVIAESMPGQGITYLNDREYSQTTNRHQYLVRAWMK